jgi:hypothetical protein
MRIRDAHAPTMLFMLEPNVPGSFEWWTKAIGEIVRTVSALITNQQCNCFSNCPLALPTGVLHTRPLGANGHGWAPLHT